MSVSQPALRSVAGVRLSEAAAVLLRVPLLLVPSDSADFDRKPAHVQDLSVGAHLQI